MSTSTFDTAALWSATALATDQNKIGAAGLSVRQRKLLTLLSQPMTVSQLASNIALPIEEVHTALDRFAKLGLARSGEPTPIDPMQLRTASSTNAAANQSPSRMPMMVGIAIAVLALVAAAAWMLRGGSSTGAPTQTQVAAPSSSAPKAPTPTGSADSADTVLPKGSAAVAAGPAAVAAPTPAPTSAPAQSAAAAAPPTKAETRAAAAAAAAALAAAAPAKAAATAAPATAPTPVPAAVAAATKAAPSPATPTVAAAVSAPAPALTPSATAAPITTAATTPAATPVATAPAAVAAPAPARITPTPTPTPAATPARATPAREIKLVNRVEPQFPRNSDADKGTVRARLQVDARGAVTGVDIIESNPPRVFDRTVRSALQQWRYEPTGEAFTTLAEISFSR